MNDSAGAGAFTKRSARTSRGMPDGQGGAPHPGEPARRALDRR